MEVVSLGEGDTASKPSPSNCSVLDEGQDLWVLAMGESLHGKYLLHILM